MDKVDCASYGNLDPITRIIKRNTERKKEAGEKNHLEVTNIEEIEKFIENFNEKQRQIEKNFENTETIEQDKLFAHFTHLNEQIQELQKFYSNATIFLRIYDKKVCQSALHDLQLKLQELENRLLPKKKFGFKNRKNKVEGVDVKNGVKKPVPNVIKFDKFETEEICGFRKKNNEVLVLNPEEIDKKDVLISDIKNCSVKLYGNPTTLHITNIEDSKIYCGPVTTSVFVENVKRSCLNLACQQLRIHDTTNTDFFIHVTSKAIIEDSKEVRFGIYNLNYEGIEEHYALSGLNKGVNNWNKVDDFNWLAVDKPSPNWSTMVT